MKEKDRFARSLLASFVVSLALFGAGATWACRKWTGPQGPLLEQDLSLQARLPGDWIDSNVRKTSQIRGRHEFWAFEKSSVAGTAIKVLENPVLRSALYPGYPQSMFSDQNLWRDYFRRDQSSTAWIPALQKSSHSGVLVYHSWLGCLDIYRRYGADVVVFGSSETFRSVVPEVLAQGSQRKVLLCTTTYSYPQQAEWVLHEMAKVEHARPSWIILGVSLWSLYQGHPAFLAGQAEKRGLFDRYLASRYGRFSFDFRPNEEFHPPRWDEVFSPTWVLLSKHRSRLREGSGPNAYLRVHPDLAAEGEFLSTAELAGSLVSFRPSFPLFKGLSSRQCEGATDTPAFEAAVRSAREAADHVLLYVPPISSRILATLPQCYLERFSDALGALRDEKTSIEAESGSAYGLTDADYVYSGEIEGLEKFDAVHTNYGGALKVTAGILEKLRGEYR